MTSTFPAKKENADLAGMDPAVLEILASRICHDLISPVGAMHNGVEFMQEAGLANSAEAIDLIAHSAQMASAKLQAFRLAYGAGGRDPNIKTDDVMKTFGAMIGSEGRVKQDWDPYAIDSTKMPQGFCKLLMGALMLAAESLPKGGTVRAVKKGDAVEVSAEGPDAAPRARVPEALALTLPPEDLDPRLVHPYILSTLAGRYGFSVTIGACAKDRAVYVLDRA